MSSKKLSHKLLHPFQIRNLPQQQYLIEIKAQGWLARIAYSNNMHVHNLFASFRDLYSPSCANANIMQHRKSLHLHDSFSLHWTENSSANCKKIKDLISTNYKIKSITKNWGEIGACLGTKDIPQILLNKNLPPDTICGHNDVIYSSKKKREKTKGHVFICINDKIQLRKVFNFPSDVDEETKFN